MTPAEREMLADLAKKIAETPAADRDPEADELIRTNIGKRPDALYILTQTVVIQNLAIQHARQEIEELKQRLAQPVAPRPASSFLGSGVSPSGPRPSGMPASPPPPPTEPMPLPITQNAPPASGASSFLRSAAQTAAGVAAGALAFEGIRSLFGGGGFGGWGGPHLGSFGGGSFLGGAPAGETIINNYYDSPDATEQNSGGDASPGNAEDSTAPDDTEASYDDTGASYEESSSDEDTYADDGGYDDGGGFGGDESS